MAHILIVDDDPETVALLDYSLRMQGHDTTQATDGLECLAAVRREPPDLIVLDHMLPGMDGLSVSHVLRSDPDTADIPIVMVTSRSGDADIWKGYQAGVASYVTKPVDLEILELEIDRLLEESPAS
jgi:two-component system, OmpR family, phosphate regulon response regulator PhoB